MMLKKLQLNDFLSHKSTVVEFKPNSKVLIDGRSGSGKTAIVEAIIWCFFGKGRLDNRSLVRNGQGSGFVDIHVGDDSRKWVIRRAITNGGTQTLAITHEVDGKVLAVPATTLKEKQEYIEKEILKCSYDLFVNSVVYPQDSGQNFVKQSAVRRKELLLEIIGAVDFDGYADRARNKMAVLEKEIGEIGVKVETNRNHLSRSEDRLKELSACVGDEPLEELEGRRDKVAGSVEKLKSDETDESKRLNDLNDRVSKETQAREYVKVLQGSIRETVDVSGHERRIKEIEAEEEKSKSISEKVSAEREKLAANEQARRDMAAADLAIRNIEERIGDRKASIEALKVERKGIKATGDDICPVTKKVCPKVEEVYRKQEEAIDGKIEVIEFEVAELDAKWDEEVKRRGRITEVEVDADFIEVMERKLAGIGELAVEKARLTVEARNAREAEAYNEDIRRKMADAAETAKRDSSADAEKAGAKLAKTRGDLEAANALLSELNQKIAVARTIEGERKQVEKVIADTREVIGILERKAENLTKSQEYVKLVREAFGANGIRVVVIDAVLPRLEKRINEILSELSDFRIKLDTQKDNKSNEGKKEGLFITIINGNGEEMDFDGYSGGEKLKIVVSISEALAELQKAEFRIIDELFIGLDDESVSQFGEVLMRLQERFSQVLCISHIQTIKDLFEDRITVKKSDGVSTCST